ncbi:glycosyltransferase family 2 protein, partial [Enterococcus faecium]
VLLDDGTGDPELAAAVAAAIEAASLPTRFISLAANQGRAKGRNLLAEQARSGFLLFLDSDMSPDQPSFLADWLNIAETDAPAVAFGGFSLK